MARGVTSEGLLISLVIVLKRNYISTAVLLQIGCEIVSKTILSLYMYYAVVNRTFANGAKGSAYCLDPSFDRTFQLLVCAATS